MPRLGPGIVREAKRIHPYLVHLLRATRDLDSARNELRWLTEFAERRELLSRNSGLERRKKSTSRNRQSVIQSSSQNILLRSCLEREHGKPLQYILGSEFFGDLEIKCRTGALIPRPETADVALELARRMKKNCYDSIDNVTPRIPRMLDLCTGTGCISFLLNHELNKDLKAQSMDEERKVLINGIDISPTAIKLAEKNRRRLLKEGSIDHRVHFFRADVLANGQSRSNAREESASVSSVIDALEKRDQKNWDIIISNPPYVSPFAYSKETTRSVRKYEPRLALIPTSRNFEHLQSTSPVLRSSSEMEDEDDTIRKDGEIFYHAILRAAKSVDAKVVVVEVGDYEQALQVARIMAWDLQDEMAESDFSSCAPTSTAGTWDGIEMWKDGLVHDSNARSETVSVPPYDIEILGSSEANVRAVMCWKEEGAKWVERSQSCRKKHESI